MSCLLKNHDDDFYVAFSSEETDFANATTIVEIIGGFGGGYYLSFVLFLIKKKNP